MASKRAQERRKKLTQEMSARAATIVSKPSNSPDELTATQLRAAKLMGRGRTLPEVAKLLEDWIVPHKSNGNRQSQRTRGKMARARLRKWVRKPAFRDAVYEEAIVKVDHEIPQILAGIVGKAKAGRVDAARLVLEITGRHSPHTEIQPAAVNVIFGEVPRPQTKQIGDGEVVDADAEIEEVEDL